MHAGSTYLVWFSYQGLPTDGTPGLVSKRVNTSTFLAVEDWADANTPDGYELRTIEKHYGTDAELAMFGEVDLTIDNYGNTVSGLY